VSESLALRAGYNDDEISFGFGVNAKLFGEDNFAFNYAYGLPSEFGSVVSHRLELRIRRGEKIVREKAPASGPGEIYWKDEGEEIELE
jgi:hypothetical protein